MHRAHRSRPLILGLAALLSVVALAVPIVAQTSPSGTLLFIGTYTSPASKGIYASRLDPSTGTLSPPVLAAEARNPSFLAASADGRFLYAVNEVDAVDGKPGGAVTAYAVDKAAGTLKALNSQSTVGGGPAHVSVAGRMVFAANYGGGSIAAYPTLDDGSLKPASTFVQHKGSGTNPDRQKGPHAHAATPDASGRFLYVPGPRPRPGAHLPHRRQGGHDRRGDAAVRQRPAGRGRAAPHRDRQEWPPRLRHHRDAVHHRRLRAERVHRRADAHPDDQHAAGRARPSRRASARPK